MHRGPFSNAGRGRNGAAIVKRAGFGIAACIGDNCEGPTLLALYLKDGSPRVVDLPRPAALVEIDSGSGKVTNVWPIAGAPDVTFFNPATGPVHVAIGEPAWSKRSIRERDKAYGQ